MALPGVPGGPALGPALTQPPPPPVGLPPAPTQTISPSNSGSPPMEFKSPNRPNHGQEGRPILLRANHFQVRMPRGCIHHYDISIVPDKCPRRVNRYVLDQRTPCDFYNVLCKLGLCCIENDNVAEHSQGCSHQLSINGFLRQKWPLSSSYWYCFVFREIIETMVLSYSQRIFAGQRPVFDGRKNLYSKEPLPIGRDKVRSCANGSHSLLWSTTDDACLSIAQSMLNGPVRSCVVGGIGSTATRRRSWSSVQGHNEVDGTS